MAFTNLFKSLSTNDAEIEKNQAQHQVKQFTIYHPNAPINLIITT